MTTTSVHFKALDSIKTTLSNLAISGVTVYLDDAPYPKTNRALPYVHVSPIGAETLPAGENNRDDYGYPCLVAIVATRSENTLQLKLEWRSTIRKALHHNPTLISAIGMGCYDVVVEPLAVVDPAAITGQFWVSAMVVRVLAQETRS
jgi:hypothetical protein